MCLSFVIHQTVTDVKSEVVIRVMRYDFDVSFILHVNKFELLYHDSLILNIYRCTYLYAGLKANKTFTHTTDILAFRHPFVCRYMYVVFFGTMSEVGVTKNRV